MTRRKGFIEEIFDIFFKTKPEPRTRKAPAKKTTSVQKQPGTPPASKTTPRKRQPRQKVTYYAVQVATITNANVDLIEGYGVIQETDSEGAEPPAGYDFMYNYSLEAAKIMRDFLRQSLKERIEAGEIKTDVLPSWWKTV